MSLKSFVIPAALAALCTACQTVETTKESVVGVNRPQHMMVSADAVKQQRALNNFFINRVLAHCSI